MRMAHGARECIGGVIGLGIVIEVQKRTDHVGHLGFICRSGANHRLFDLHRGVLPHLNPAKRAGHEGGTACMGGRDGGTDVGPEVYSLNSRLLG